MEMFKSAAGHVAEVQTWEYYICHWLHTRDMLLHREE